MIEKAVAVRRNPLILVADDDKTTRLLIRHILTQNNMDVVEAENGAQAIDKTIQCKPDAILMDVQMPHLNGLEACRLIRAKENHRHTPIALVTGQNDGDSIESAYEAGATDFIAKPINETLLPHRLRYILRSTNAHNELASLVQAIPDMIFIVNRAGTVLHCLNDNNGRSGIPKEDLVDKTLSDILPRDAVEAAMRSIQKALDTATPQAFEHAIDSSDSYFETRLVSRDHDTVVAIVRDITARKHSEQRIHRLAYFDKLTNLPNRHLFAGYIERAIRVARATDTRFALMYIDLDHFKRINDTLGHTVGDSLLRGVAKRLKSCTRPGDEVSRIDLQETNGPQLARLGGDEFAVLLTDLQQVEDAAAVADRLRAALTTPFRYEQHQFVVSPSIGIAMYPDNGTTRDQLLMNADTAMYKAKNGGRNNSKFYDEGMNAESLERLVLEDDIRHAIESKAFQLHYQPKLDLASNKIVGAEALIRWQHSERGSLLPDKFIPLAEETGLIVPLGQWVIEEACNQLQKWHDSPLQDIQIAVNISGHQFTYDNLLELMVKAAQTANINSANLELEITESALMGDSDEMVDLLNSIKDLDVSIAIDDFGTGYSSLSYLKRFPVDKLKIDRSFVQNISTDKDDAAICGAIIAMSKQLGLKVIAEGVENQEQLDFLSQHHCDQVQGYLIGPAIPPEEFEKLILQHRNSRNSRNSRKEAVPEAPALDELVNLSD